MEYVVKFGAPQGYKIQRVGKGQIPKPLRGSYTSRHGAIEAADSYLAKTKGS